MWSPVTLGLHYTHSHELMHFCWVHRRAWVLKGGCGNSFSGNAGSSFILVAMAQSIKLKFQCDWCKAGNNFGFFYCQKIKEWEYTSGGPEWEWGVSDGVVTLKDRYLEGTVTTVLMKAHVSSWVMHTLIPALRRRRQADPVSSRQALSTKPVPAKPRLHKETLSVGEEGNVLWFCSTLFQKV